MRGCLVWSLCEGCLLGSLRMEDGALGIDVRDGVRIVEKCCFAYGLVRDVMRRGCLLGRENRCVRRHNIHAKIGTYILTPYLDFISAHVCVSRGPTKKVESFLSYATRVIPSQSNTIN